MEYIINSSVELLKNIVLNSNIIISFIVGMGIIIIESFIPILPLAVFIAINMIVFGNFIGFSISYIATIIGCSLSFFVFRKLRTSFYKKIETKPKIKDLMYKIDKISFSSLVIILAIPFTPAFSINIGAGLSTISYKKYLFSLFISKIFLVYFWGFIGTTFIESITDIGVIIKLVFIILIAFILSKFVMKHFNIK